MSLRDCCRDPNLRDLVEERETPNGTMVLERCADCGRRHYTAKVDPKEFGLALEGDEPAADVRARLRDQLLKQAAVRVEEGDLTEEQLERLRRRLETGG